MNDPLYNAGTNLAYIFKYVSLFFNHLVMGLKTNLTTSCMWQNEEAFFTDYAASHKKLSELGFTSPYKAKTNALPGAKSSVLLAAIAFVIGAITYAKWLSFMKYI